VMHAPGEPWRFGALVLTTLVYSNSFGTGFAIDNRRLILEDPRIQAATALRI